ncbi:MAG: hypothetical protein RRZ64_05445 [Rikenellaceae bacterium]
MIKTDGKNVIIEIPDTDMANYVTDLQRGLISAIRCFDYDNYGSQDSCPFHEILELLSETLPTYNELRYIMAFKELARNRTLEAIDLSEWVVDQITDYNIHNSDLNTI